MVILTARVAPDLEDHRTEAVAAPADRTELPRIIVLLVNHVRLVKDLLCLFQAETVLLLGRSALLRIELKAHTRI